MLKKKQKKNMIKEKYNKNTLKNIKSSQNTSKEVFYFY